VKYTYQYLRDNIINISVRYKYGYLRENMINISVRYKYRYIRKNIINISVRYTYQYLRKIQISISPWEYYALRSSSSSLLSSSVHTRTLFINVSSSSLVKSLLYSMTGPSLILNRFIASSLQPSPPSSILMTK